MQSVPITTNIVGSNPDHGEVYSIQHYVIRFVSDLSQVGGFLRTHTRKRSIHFWNIIRRERSWHTTYIIGAGFIQIKIRSLIFDWKTICPIVLGVSTSLSSNYISEVYTSFPCMCSLKKKTINRSLIIWRNF
jgi:hypothetical protein